MTQPVSSQSPVTPAPEAPPVSAPAKPKMSMGVKFALELGPLVLFFASNAYAGIFVATGIFMAATIVALGLMWVLARKIAIMPLVSAILVAVFGAATLIWQDDHFIKLKPTILNAMFGVLLLGGLVFRKPLLPYVFDGAVRLTPEGWRLLTIRWAVFFLVMAVLNEVVWRNMSTDAWMNVKTFGYLPLTFIFAMAQAPLMARFEDKSAPAEGA
ncbi:septation protein A [Xanthobacteraceae bacterium A53D]